MRAKSYLRMRGYLSLYWLVVASVIAMGLSVSFQATAKQIEAPSIDQVIASRIRENLKLSKHEKEWLDNHPVIKVGVDAGYAPYSFLDSSGQFQGAAVDYLSLLSASLGVQFEAVPNLSWQEIVSGAKSRDLDLIATAVVTPERKEFLDFTQIYLSTPLVIMTQKSVNGIASGEQLEGKRVALVEKYSSSQRVLKEHPNIIKHPVTNPLEGLRALAAGEVDAYVGVLGVNFYLAQQHGLTNLKVAGRYDLKTNGQRLAVRSDWVDLRVILDKALDLITSQDHIHIINRWIPLDSTGMAMSLLDAPPLEFTAEELAWLRAHPKITIGTMNAWPPMDYVDEEGVPVGIGAKFIELLNQRLNGVLEIVPGDWSTIYKNVKEKKLDALIGITPQKEREQFFHFTKPYVTVPHVIFTRKSMPYLKDIQSLKGKIVALEKGFFLKSVIQDKYPLVKFDEFDSTSDALDAVVKGNADAYIGNRAVAMYIIHNELIPNLEEHGKIKETASVNAIAVRKDWPILRGILQKTLDNITVKERFAILQNWVMADPLGHLKSVKLTADEWAWLDNNSVIRVAGDPIWAPVEYRDQEDRYKGIAVEYLALLSDALGVRFEYDTTSTWSQATGKLERRELDIFAAAAPTSSRQKYARFTEPYLSLPAMVFTRDDVAYISGMNNLEGRKVAVVRGYAISEYMRRSGWNIELVEVDHIEQGLELVQAGEVFAYIGSILTTSHVLREKGYTNIRVSGQTPYKIDVSIGVRSDWPVLTRILDKALASISDTQKANIAARWIGVRIKEAPDYSLFWKIFAVGLIVIGLCVAWNWYLRKVNAVQSKEISVQSRILIKSKKSLAEAQRIAKLGSWEWNLETGDFHWSLELYRILGFSGEASSSSFQHFIETVHFDDRQRVERLLNESKETLQPFSFEHRVTCPDDTVRYVQEQGEVQVNGGHSFKMTGTVLDITERKQAEQEISKLLYVFDNSPISIVITDLEGKIEYVNPCFTEVTGYTSEEAIEQNPSILSTGHTSAAEYKKLWKTITEGNIWRGEFRNRRKNGELYWENAIIAPVFDDSGNIVNFLGVKQDISFQKEMAAELFLEANYSSLTKQPNRSFMLNLIDQNIRDEKPLTILLIDMINLKRINDSLGLEAGDSIISQAAERLNQFVEPLYTIGHLGGGQFLVHIEKPREFSIDIHIGEILKAFEQPFQVQGESIRQGVCIGISQYPEDASSSGELLSKAHAAVAQAKLSGPYSHAYFSAEYNIEAHQLLHMESQLRTAIEKDELEVFCQPKVDVSGNFIGAEALLRWFSKGLGPIPPDKFIPLAEQTGLILDIGRWVIKESCRQASQWPKMGEKGYSVSINMSPRQFLDRGVVNFLKACMEQYSLSGSQVEIEVTEGLFLENEKEIQDRIGQLKEMGVSLTMDDFGTGYSSLQYLRKFSFDVLKIDRSFVAELPESKESRSLVQAIISMSRSLEVVTVAEGVETKEQSEFLHQEGCDLFQGYFYGRPMAESDFLEWLDKNQP